MSASARVELRAAFDEPFWDLGRDAARDRETVLLSWPSAPVELVRAAGFAPVFARGAGAPTPAADRVLEAGLFPSRLRQLVEAALSGMSGVSDTGRTDDTNDTDDTDAKDGAGSAPSAGVTIIEP